MIEGIDPKVLGRNESGISVQEQSVAGMTYDAVMMWQTNGHAVFDDF